VDGKADGKRPLARPRHRWEVSTEICLELVGWERVFRIIPSQDRHEPVACEHGNEASVFIK
jgi:hypothetical protein